MTKHIVYFECISLNKLFFYLEIVHVVETKYKKIKDSATDIAVDIIIFPKFLLFALASWATLWNIVVYKKIYQLKLNVSVNKRISVYILVLNPHLVWKKKQMFLVPTHEMLLKSDNGIFYVLYVWFRVVDKIN